MLYYFSCFMAGLSTVQCVYFYKSNSHEIRTPQVEFAKEASQFQNTFWENHDVTEQTVITFIYWVGKFMHTVYLIFHTVFL
jgi:hypothetical protein